MLSLRAIEDSSLVRGILLQPIRVSYADGRALPWETDKEDCMSALIRQVALVSLTHAVPARAVMRISAALQKQATRDLGPVWDVSATVDAFDQLGHVPV